MTQPPHGPDGGVEEREEPGVVEVVFKKRDGLPDGTYVTTVGVMGRCETLDATLLALWTG
jgi:hypothetical protein